MWDFHTQNSFKDKIQAKRKRYFKKHTKRDINVTQLVPQPIRTVPLRHTCYWIHKQISEIPLIFPHQVLLVFVVSVYVYLRFLRLRPVHCPSSHNQSNGFAYAFVCQRNCAVLSVKEKKVVKNSFKQQSFKRHSPPEPFSRINLLGRQKALLRV